MDYSDLQRKSLSKSIELNKIPHALIITGGHETGRKEYVENLLQEVFCQNEGSKPCGHCLNCRKISNNNMEDIMYTHKDGNSIKVDQIKEINSFLKNKPIGARNAVVINEADSMTSESQNKLLKSLEEPAPGTVIILTVENIYNLYQTIRSRCLIINMPGGAKKFDPQIHEVSANIVKYTISNKPFHMIYRDIEEIVKSPESARRLLDSVELLLRDIMVGEHEKKLIWNEENNEIINRINYKKRYPFDDYLRYIEDAKKDIKRNINWKYTLKSLIINMKQEEIHG